MGAEAICIRIYNYVTIDEGLTMNINEAKEEVTRSSYGTSRNRQDCDNGADCVGAWNRSCVLYDNSSHEAERHRTSDDL